MLVLNVDKLIKIIISKNWILFCGPKGIIVKKKKITTLIFKKLNNIYLFDLNIYKKFLHNILGVNIGFCFKLRLIGVGYKISILKNKILFRLGWSHDYLFLFNNEKIKIIQPKQKIPFFIIFGISLNYISYISSLIRNLKKPDVYKGKGICFDKEILKLKKIKKSNE